MRIRRRSMPFPVLFLAVAGLTATAFATPAAMAASLSESAAERAVAISAGTALGPISNMVVLVDATADQEIHATDADGDPLTFSKAFGPAFMTVATTIPGTGSATGNIHLAPGAGDLGETTGAVSVTDGTNIDQRSFLIQVTLPGAAPVLVQPSDMSVEAGHVETQELHATDANGDPIEFYLWAGPSYVTVFTDDPGIGTAVGTVRAAPGPTLQDTASVYIGVTDGVGVDVKAFLLTITNSNDAPVLAPIGDVNLRAGETRDVPLSATDANGDPLTFLKQLGPSIMTVTTTDPGQGTATGVMHVESGPSDAGTFSARISVTDGFLSDEESFNVIVRANRGPFIAFIEAMTLHVEESATQTVSAIDFDGDPVQLSKASGPPYMTVVELPPINSTFRAEIQLNPLASNAGTTTGSIRASDGLISNTRSFNITVLPPNNPPVLAQPDDMTVVAGEQVEQPVSATDPDGDFVHIFKESGPDFVTVWASLITVIPGVGDIGTAAVTVAATDSYYLKDTKTFTVTVTAGNFPPPCPADNFLLLSNHFESGTIEVQTADLDGNGMLDMVVELPDAGVVKVALGRGDGTFDPPTDLIAGTIPVSGVIGDFNRDEVPDVAINNATGNVSVFLGDGTGSFGPRQNFPAGASRSMVAADINLDSKLDLLTTGTGVSILLGVGDGTFTATASVPTGGLAWALVAPDLNGDGAPDLAVTKPDSAMIAVYINNGTGTFGPRSLIQVGYGAHAITSGDLNRDGNADLVVSSDEGKVSVLLGMGDGTFRPLRSFTAGTWPRQLAIADMNADGHLDVAVASLGGETPEGQPLDGETSIYLGDGSGALGPRSSIIVPPQAYGIAAGDLDNDLRTDLAVASYSGYVTILLNRGCAPDQDHPPVVSAPKNVAATEGAVVTFSITAGDPDGPDVTGLAANVAALPLGNNAAFTPAADFSGGTFTWTPTFQDARPTPYPVTFTATNNLSGSAMTNITVAAANRAPVAQAGGPYTAFTGAPLVFDGSGSSDPDGDELTYAWTFGDGVTGIGVNPSHAYAAAGVYGVALSVTDGSLTSLSTTTASIVGIFQARAFTSGGSRTIRLGSGKPQWSVHIEPVAGSYSNAAVDLGSLVMKSAGTGSVGEISAIASKTVVGGDKDGNGAEEISVSFSKADLRLLFSNLHGNSSATVTIEGSLFAGGVFRASLDVGVIAGGSNLAASVSPNPLNPSAVLTFFTTKPGPVRIRAFDPQGRLVRTMLQDPGLAAGYHDVALDGRDDHGTPLASGVYYYRLEAAEGVTSGRFTVLR